MLYNTADVTPLLITHQWNEWLYYRSFNLRYIYLDQEIYSGKLYFLVSNYVLAIERYAVLENQLTG